MATKHAAARLGEIRARKDAIMVRLERVEQAFSDAKFTPEEPDEETPPDEETLRLTLIRGGRDA